MRHASSARDAGAEFLAAFRSAGLTPPEIIVSDGKLHRFSTNGKRGDDSGWYVFHDDGIQAGAFGDWRSDLSRTWRADIGRDLTPAEMVAHQARVDAARRAREAEEARRHAEAARNASSIWKTSTSTSSTHPYLARKQIAPVESLRDIEAGVVVSIAGYAPKYRDEPLAGRLLVVPIKVAGELSSVEFIDEVGRKSALYGGAKAGGYWAAQPLPNGDGAGLTLLIGEGVATVLSAREATGYLVIAALSCGNLLQVAPEMRKRYPAAKLGILADLGNGQKDAEEAARVTGSALVLPDFGLSPSEGKKDFNDMQQHRGREAVAECIRRQVDAGEPATALRLAMRPVLPHQGRALWKGCRAMALSGTYPRPPLPRSYGYFTNGSTFPTKDRCMSRLVRWPRILWMASKYGS